MRTISGINIQAPWATLLTSGKKTVETRTYRMPTKHVGAELAVIETPGRHGKFKARIIGVVVFGPSYEYATVGSFEKDFEKHLVESSDKGVGWPASGTKWAWPVVTFQKFDKTYPAPYPRGIVFATNCMVPSVAQDAASSSDSTGSSARIRSSIADSNP